MPASLLLFAERYPPDLGGVARSAARTARTLRSLGVEVDVLTHQRQQPPGALQTQEEDGITVHRLGPFANLDFTLQHTANVLEWLQRERGYAAVWGHYLYPAGFAAVLLAKQQNIPVVVSARGNDVDRLMFPPGDFARLLWTLERADVVTAVSKELARKIDILLGTDGRALQVPNSVDAALFTPGPPDAALRERLGIAADERVLGFCGEFRHKKGFPFLLQALVDVRRERPACLLVIGEVRTRDMAHLHAFAAQQPEAAERILVTGSLDDQREVAACYRLCDVFLQPSVWDGMPNAVLEAMACGRLVLCSDAGGLPEAVEHQVSGFVLPKAQLHRLGMATLELLAQPDEVQQRYASAARERMQQHFHADVERAALRTVLARLSPSFSS